MSPTTLLFLVIIGIAVVIRLIISLVVDENGE
jgi:hypothetical protein